jgi:lycopene cyclase domain-containing protein
LQLLRKRMAHAGAVLALLALAYTTPWDNYLVYKGIWSYPPGRVMATIGWVPIEEYMFFVIQTALTSLWFLAGAPRQYLSWCTTCFTSA